MPDRIDLQPVLNAAMTLVAADGLKGLSLRPLAQMALDLSQSTQDFGQIVLFTRQAREMIVLCL